MPQMNRRCFLGRAAMSTLGAGLTLTGVCPPLAEAQFTAFLSFALSNNPILAVVDLFEIFYNKSSSANAPTVGDVVARVDKLSQSLKARLDDMPQQFRAILVDILKENDLRRDTMQLASLSYSLNIATARGAAVSEILNVSIAIDQIAHSLGDYGAAGSLAYLNAIALQNSVHRMMQSSPNVLLQVNMPHDERLGQIIYDGKQADSLETAILKKRSEMASDPYYRNYEMLKDRIGSWYLVGYVTRFYESQASSNCELRFTYEGFAAGQLVGSRWCGPETFGPNANNLFRGRVARATFTPLHTNDVLPVLVRSDNTLTFPQNWPCGQALVNQVNLIAEDYRRFYNTNYGPDINSRTSLDLGMTPEQATLRNFLINTGLGSVKRIISLATQQLT